MNAATMNTANSITAMPLVSVVMPVRNGMPWLALALDSVLAQTYTNIEVIIINDGSTDGTSQYLAGLTDSRVRVIDQDNVGVCLAANRGFALASGEFITRHDHDDISLPERLTKQVAFLKAHPQIALVGSWAQIWQGEHATRRSHRHPISPGLIAFELLFNDPFVNSSVLFRKSVFDHIGGYTTDTARSNPEDYEFISRVARSFWLANVPEYLVIYRELESSHSSVIRPLSQIDSITNQNDKDEHQSFAGRLVLFSAENLSLLLGEPALSATAHNFGALVHSQFHLLQTPFGADDFAKVISLVRQAAMQLAVQFPDEAVLKAYEAKLPWLHYQYHTALNHTYHPRRLCYLAKHRTWNENWLSVKKALRKLLAFDTNNT